jgi:hypothetical protein
MYIIIFPNSMLTNYVHIYMYVKIAMKKTVNNIRMYINIYIHICICIYVDEVEIIRIFMDRYI